MNFLGKLCALKGAKAAACLALCVAGGFAPVFAQKIGGNATFSGGVIRMDNENLKTHNGSANISLDFIKSKNVKAYFEAGMKYSFVPKSEYLTEGYVGSLRLNKAYLKIRLPWFGGDSSRLTVGKMPLGFGYGLYYNSGDIIFGADPNNLFPRHKERVTFNSVQIKDEYKTLFTYQGINSAEELMDSGGSSFSSLSAGGLSDVRTQTDWMCLYTMPFGEAVSVDALAVLPVDTTLNGKSGRYGARAQFRADLGLLEAAEIGALARGDGDSVIAYAGIDGTLWLDYNLCSSVFFDRKGAKAEGSALPKSGFDEKRLNFSTALTKTFTVRTDIAEHALQLRSETLYYPFEHQFNIFGFASYGINDNTSLSLNYMRYHQKAEETESIVVDQYCGFSLTWTPVRKLDLSLQGLTQIKRKSPLRALNVSVSYKY